MIKFIKRNKLATVVFLLAIFFCILFANISQGSPESWLPREPKPQFYWGVLVAIVFYIVIYIADVNSENVKNRISNDEEDI